MNIYVIFLWRQIKVNIKIWKLLNFPEFYIIGRKSKILLFFKTMTFIIVRQSQNWVYELNEQFYIHVHVHLPLIMEIFQVHTVHCNLFLCLRSLGVFYWIIWNYKKYKLMLDLKTTSNDCFILDWAILLVLQSYNSPASMFKKPYTHTVHEI